MMDGFEFKPGSLVTLRNRPWIVMPSDNEQVFLVKPLGGTHEEITGIFKPLANESDRPASYSFVKPSAADLGDFASAKLLYNAARLSFRNAAGPFRCLGKLSFRPRSYQMVPLIMALKQPVTRLLIADDVGVGKTIEALLIAKELYERKDIKRFAVVCLPHLCDQWQEEIKSKFGIEAVIIRSGTATGLERKIRTHETIFHAYPFQIISIDYIKSGLKRQVFIDHCPEFVIVDEAHTCARPAGANNTQQLRYHLLREIAANPRQHLLLITATPHSGKQEEFQSLLGLLNSSFEKTDIASASILQQKAIAACFIQRRRKDVLTWLDEETKFPDRVSLDLAYEISKDYALVFNDILSYAREVVRSAIRNTGGQRYSYWDALALLRGVMSSPAAGVAMLKKKARKKQLHSEENEPEADVAENILDKDHGNDDTLPLASFNDNAAVNDTEAKKLMDYARRLQELASITHDHKAREAVAQSKQIFERGGDLIIFCRYIQTANYLGEVFRAQFKGKNYKDLHIEVVTSELNDELRREKIELMNRSARRLLIATDCLSEGINLQQGFNALLHYDLPWNPNRLEQREGRIDRFGQRSPSVEVHLLYGSNNPIDGVVLDVLLRKAKEIRRSIGVAIPFPEDSATVMQAVTNAILLKPQVVIKQVAHQLTIFEAEEIEAEKNKVARAFEAAELKEKESRRIFAQNAIPASEIEDDLKEVDEAIGDVKAVAQFVIQALRFMGVQADERKEGYVIYPTNIPQRLRELLPAGDPVWVSFDSPTPYGYHYLGRNHPFTEHLAQSVINNALERLTGQRAARAAVLRTAAVKTKTVMLQLRVRNVIAEQPSNKQVVAEEMWLWGYTGDLENREFLDRSAALELLQSAKTAQNMEVPEQRYWLEEETGWIHQEADFRAETDRVALDRAAHLVESHTKFKKLVGGSKYKVVEPVLPMDVLGMYILLPVIN